MDSSSYRGVTLSCIMYDELSTFDWSSYMITKEHLDNWFTYHSPKPEQVPQYTAIRAAGLHLAAVILDNTPASADQSAAIRCVREAVMTANAAIACGGR